MSTSQPEPSAGLIVAGLALTLVISPACVVIALATASGGSSYYHTSDQPNTGWLFTAGFIALTGIACGLTGLYRLLQTIDRIGGVTAQRERIKPRATAARTDAGRQARAAAARRSTKPPTV